LGKSSLRPCTNSWEGVSLLSKRIRR